VTVRSRRAACQAFGLAAVVLAVLARPAAADPAAEWPRSVVGVADVRLVGGSGRTSSRLVFAAAVEPLALRVEVVRGGRAQALVWADTERVRILVPDSPPLLLEGPPTRETLGEALGLPFCPDELVFALRAGRAPRPACGDADAVASVETDGDRVVALSRRRDGDVPAVSLRFSRFERAGERTWPRRVRLTTEGTEATVDFSTVEERAQPPLPMAADALGPARSVSAAEMGRVLGLMEPEGP